MAFLEKAWNKLTNSDQKRSAGVTRGHTETLSKQLASNRRLNRVTEKSGGEHISEDKLVSIMKQ